MIDDGARIIKLFFHITEDEQLTRFRERLTNPYKRWKLTEEDLRNRPAGTTTWMPPKTCSTRLRRSRCHGIP